MIPYEIFRFLLRRDESWEWREGERSWFYGYLAEWSVPHNNFRLHEVFVITKDTLAYTHDDVRFILIEEALKRSHDWVDQLRAQNDSDRV